GENAGERDRPFDVAGMNRDMDAVGLDRTADAETVGLGMAVAGREAELDAVRRARYIAGGDAVAGCVVARRAGGAHDLAGRTPRGDPDARARTGRRFAGADAAHRSVRAFGHDICAGRGTRLRQETEELAGI